MGDLSSQRELGRVEQFMLGLLAMPDHTHRLRAIRVKKVFEEIEADYNPTFELLHVAMQGRIATVLFSHASTYYFSIISLFVSLSHTHSSYVFVACGNARACDVKVSETTTPHHFAHWKLHQWCKYAAHDVV